MVSMAEFEELGAMEKLDKEKVLYIQMLRINKMFSEGDRAVELAIDTLECNLWADLQKINWYVNDLSKLVTSTNIKMKNITKQDKIDREMFEHLKKKYRLLVMVMMKRGLWGEERGEDTIDYYEERDNKPDTEAENSETE